MRINIRAISFKLTHAIGSHAKRQAGRLLDSIPGSAARATVSLDDVNGQRGGIDKSCRITLRAPRVGTIMAEAVDRDLYSAINRACARLRSALRRRMERRGQGQRRAARRHAAASPVLPAMI